MVKVHCPGGRLLDSKWIDEKFVQIFEQPSDKTFAQCRHQCGEDHIYCGPFGKAYIPYINKKRMNRLKDKFK